MHSPLIRLFKINQVAGGWLAVIICKRTEKVCRITIEEIRPDQKVNELTADALIERGGLDV